MRFIAIIIASFFFLSNAVDTNAVDNKKREIKVDAGIYTVLYSEALEQPKEVWYTVECTDGRVSRKGMDFYTNDSIYTSSKEDYENNEWDKGHMAPAADFSCEKTTLYQTFSYLNCSLQHQDLNRGVWRLLESRERELAKKTDVEIHILVDFTKGTKKLPSGATVPGGYRKEIRYSGKTEVYYFKNEKPLSNSFDKYIVKN